MANWFCSRCGQGNAEAWPSCPRCGQSRFAGGAAPYRPPPAAMPYPQMPMSPMAMFPPGMAPPLAQVPRQFPRRRMPNWAYPLIGVGLLPLFCCLGTIIYQTAIKHGASERIRKHEQEYVSIPVSSGLGSRGLRPTQRGYIRGKCVLIDYDSSTSTGHLHKWHQPDVSFTKLKWGILAETDEEAQTIVWLEQSEVVVGRYRGFANRRAIAVILTATIIDRARGRVVGQFTLRGDPPGMTRGSSDVKGFVTREQLLKELRQLPAAPP